MLNAINEIIKSVGNSKKKLYTLIILLVFMASFYVFKTLTFKNDCLPLIEQNQKLLSKNIDIMNLNNDLTDNNNNLLNKITKLEKTILEIDRDTIYIPIHTKNELISNNQIKQINDSVTINNNESHHLSLNNTSVSESITEQVSEKIDETLSLNIPVYSFKISDLKPKEDTIQKPQNSNIKNIFNFFRKKPKTDNKIPVKKIKDENVDDLKIKK